MKYKQIKPKKIYEEVTEAIYGMIQSGQLMPGDKLDSVQQLAENFQVGRSAIREALSALRAMGLLEMKQGEGTYVKAFDSEQIHLPLSTVILMNKEDIKNLLEVRKIIETGAVAIAAKNRTEGNLHAMKEALDDLKNAYKNEGLIEKADFKFHLAIAEASQNVLLASLLNHISELTQEAMKETHKISEFSKQASSEEIYEEHLEIYKAILESDENYAVRAMLKHLDHVEAILKKYF
ncbi:FadR/GntR family transcriptional regulator [Bacillus sp. DTU_2020_1000418_1_SI_GHA_SEK_038]|uniref:FadR/GntR family transcriptional regulator n=1 Tax=Bacillus sp. DTU_2020_1000418_1_SI_GHA_SEK_038 TaxID=3077585 RepID=UPI0028EA857D|nr:FadR/GntR family transcriptional regulator [Bacillus sp. DTU_2020_1000418_1_SI_GHA_SEK_038]WNS75760.1 FadR/GntR family transcriptional regulator [Bacillus sp. DTU_2020_1000418_1_SI_GHA_SEK_038]